MYERVCSMYVCVYMYVYMCVYLWMYVCEYEWMRGLTEEVSDADLEVLQLRDSCHYLASYHMAPPGYPPLHTGTRQQLLVQASANIHLFVYRLAM